MQKCNVILILINDNLVFVALKLKKSQQWLNLNLGTKWRQSKRDQNTFHSWSSFQLCQRGVAGVVGNKDYSRLTEFENACAGGSAAFFSSLALCPTELIKCKLQAMREVAQAKNVGC